MNPTILIVDDSAVTRMLIKRAIQMADFPVAAVLEAGHGREALARLAEQPVHLVLADLHMPEMGGAELIDQMRQDPNSRDIPVVIISAEPSTARIDELCRLGARGYLRKPFTPEALRTTLLPLLEPDHAHA